MGIPHATRFCLFVGAFALCTLSYSAHSEEVQRTTDTNQLSMFTTGSEIVHNGTQRVDGASTTANRSGAISLRNLDGTLIAETLGAAGSELGRAIDQTEDDKLIVGAPGFNNDKGAVYIIPRLLIGQITLTGGTLPPGVERLQYPHSSSSAQMGRVVAYMSTPLGKFIFAGAAGADEVIVFKKVGVHFQYLHTLEAPHPNVIGFGSGLATGDMDGDGKKDDIAIGNPQARPSGAQKSGAVYVKFDVDAITGCTSCALNPDHTLAGPHQHNSEFGESVDYVRPVLAVGAPAFDRPDGSGGTVPNSGAGFVYKNGFSTYSHYGIFSDNDGAGIAVGLIEIDGTTNPKTIDLAISARDAGEAQVYRVSTPHSQMQGILTFQQPFVYDAPVGATPITRYPDLNGDGVPELQVPLHTLITPPTGFPNENASSIRSGVGTTPPVAATHFFSQTAACIKPHLQSENWLAATQHPVLSLASGGTTATPIVGDDYSIKISSLPQNPSTMHYLESVWNAGWGPRLVISWGDAQTVQHPRYNPCSFPNNSTGVLIFPITPADFNASNEFHKTVQLSPAMPASLLGVPLNVASLFFWVEDQPNGPPSVMVGQIGESMTAITGP